MYRRNVNKKKENFFNNINYWFIVMGFSIELFIGLLYYQSSDPYDAYFGTISLMQGVFTLLGFVAMNIILYNRFDISYRNLKMPSSYTFPRVILMSGIVAVVQLLIFIIPATVKDYEKVLAIAFAGVCEEVMYRGLIIGPFIRIRRYYEKKNFNFSFDVGIPVILEKKQDNRRIRRTVGIFELMALLLSATIFTAVHFNYYGNFLALLSVYIGGLVWAFFYIYWRDITSLMLSHFLINFVFSIRTFFGVNLSSFTLDFLNYPVLFFILLSILIITILILRKYEFYIKNKN